MIDGLVEPGFGGVADALARQPRAPRRRRRGVLRLRRRPARRRHLGRVADVATGRPWTRRHASRSSSPPRRARPRSAPTCSSSAGCSTRTRRVAEVLARVRARTARRTIPLRAVLSHRAGLPVVEGDFTLETALALGPGRRAARDARRRAGTGTSRAPGYHVRSYGWLTGEIVRRVTGRTIGRFFAEEIAGPLGLDWWIGLPEARGAAGRDADPAAAARGPRDPRAHGRRSPRPGTMTGDALSGPSNLFHYDEHVEHPRSCTRAELPSSNGIGSAHASRAAVRGDGRRGRRPPRARARRPCTRATEIESDGTDRVLGLPMQFGLGFSLGPSPPARVRPARVRAPGRGRLARLRRPRRRASGSAT